MHPSARGDELQDRVLDHCHDVFGTFVAVNADNTVLRYRLAATRRRPTVIRPGFLPDNLRYAPDGRLLVAGPKPDPAWRPDDDECPQISVVKALDLQTLSLEHVVEIPAEPAFSELSSALIVGRRLGLGSPSENRAADMMLPPPTAQRAAH